MAGVATSSTDLDGISGAIDTPPSADPRSMAMPARSRRVLACAGAEEAAALEGVLDA